MININEETKKLEETTDMSIGWGSIMVGVRLEKMVEAKFVSTAFKWLTEGLRPGDTWGTSEGMVAHSGANNLVRQFLKTKCDSMLFIDSDAEIDFDFINRFRDHQPGWEFDALQAFYLVRGWPPEAIWFKRDERGILHKCVIFGEATEEVALVGLHCVLIKRHVIETMLGDNNPDEFDWFFYPRGKNMTEDAAFSEEAIGMGFKLGATSAVVANHIAHLSIGWETYQEYLQTSGKSEQVTRFNRIMDLMRNFTGLLEHEILDNMKNSRNSVRDAWNRISPKSTEEVKLFYGKEDNGYLFDLMNWNTDLFYINITRPLREYSGKNVLVIGAGLGEEAEILAYSNKVDIFEFPGILRDFCKKRLGNSIKFFNKEYDLYDTWMIKSPKTEYDLIVAIDVIEHIHPDEFEKTMKAISMMIVPGGQLYCHNNFKQQDIYPMHYNHEENFNAWLLENKFAQTGQFVFTKET